MSCMLVEVLAGHATSFPASQLRTTPIRFPCCCVWRCRVCAGRTPGIKAAFLIDPVDGTTATAGQPGYPSAVDALRGQDKRLGLTGKTSLWG